MFISETYHHCVDLLQELILYKEIFYLQMWFYEAFKYNYVYIVLRDVCSCMQ